MLGQARALIFHADGEGDRCGLHPCSHTTTQPESPGTVCWSARSAETCAPSHGASAVIISHSTTPYLHTAHRTSGYFWSTHESYGKPTSKSRSITRNIAGTEIKGGAGTSRRRKPPCKLGCGEPQAPSTAACLPPNSRSSACIGERPPRAAVGHASHVHRAYRTGRSVYNFPAIGG